MITTILAALLPVLVTLGLGYFSASVNDFSWADAGILTKLVMTYALPLNLFVGMIQTSKSTVLDMGPVALVLTIALVVSFFVPLLVIHYVFRRSLANATLQALAIGAPAIPFIGSSVLPPLFGNMSASLITASGFTQNLIQMPLTYVLMAIAEGSHEPGLFWKQLGSAIKQPIVWAPVLALLFVFSGLGLPASVTKSLNLLGQATGGLSLFAAGIVIFSRHIKLSWMAIATVFTRNIIVPIALLLILSGVGMSAGNIRQAVLTMAIPTGPIVIILAMKFKTGEQEMASSMALSVLFSVVTMGALIWYTA
ncbi:AEC family transporter [Caballeronia sp. DA-9]|uniref:AEC family transporter n=1 Tax=Caballeronia sp. DA-9 TaxID=3436237 RepID=UPI003F663025